MLRRARNKSVELLCESRPPVAEDDRAIADPDVDIRCSGVNIPHRHYSKCTTFEADVQKFNTGEAWLAGQSNFLADRIIRSKDNKVGINRAAQGSVDLDDK